MSERSTAAEFGEKALDTTRNQISNKGVSLSLGAGTISVLAAAIPLFISAFGPVMDSMFDGATQTNPNDDYEPNYGLIAAGMIGTLASAFTALIASKFATEDNDLGFKPNLDKTAGENLDAVTNSMAALSGAVLISLALYYWTPDDDIEYYMPHEPTTIEATEPK